MKRQMVVFKVGQGEFAVDILTTKEVVPMREITPVPETPEYVEGVMNLRGNLVPVLDLRKRMRSSDRGMYGDARIIVANCDGKLVGLIVDGTSDVVRVDENQIEAPPDIVSEIGAQYVEGVINLGHRFVTLIDIERALSEEVICELDELMQALAVSQAATLPPAQAV